MSPSAPTAMVGPDLTALLSNVKTAAETHSATANDRSRSGLREAALALAASLETPVEAAMRSLFQTHRFTALRIAVEGQWFEALSTAAKGTLTAGEIGERVGADQELVKRIMRILVVEGVVAEVGVETYACNHITRIFTAPGIRDGIKYW